MVETKSIMLGKRYSNTPDNKKVIGSIIRINNIIWRTLILTPLRLGVIGYSATILED